MSIPREMPREMPREIPAATLRGRSPGVIDAAVAGRPA
jgi:hypothetical protein